MHKRITDPTFKYVPAAATDISKTFKRVIAEQKRLAAENEREAAAKVAPIKKARTA